jgi:hypothetical protein
MRNIASQETGDRRRKPKECRAILWRSASAFRLWSVAARSSPLTLASDVRRDRRLPTCPLPSSRATGSAHVIVNPGGTNERFDRAHLQKATIVQMERQRHDLRRAGPGQSGSDDHGRRGSGCARETASRRPMPSSSESAIRPFGARLLDAARSDFRGLGQSMAEPARSVGRASGDPRNSAPGGNHSSI